MIKLTFYSNFLNHHQTPVCDEFYKRLGLNFTFVSTIKMPEQFLKSGYPDCSNYVYNLKAFENESSYLKALELGIESDVVIIGSAPDVFIKSRLSLNKHTFRYSERLFKKSNWNLLDPRNLLSFYNSHFKYRKKNLYMLCAGAYVADDLNLIYSYPQKMYRWGYFTEVLKLDIKKTINNKPVNNLNLLWTGRFIEWKHPELALRLACELKKLNYNFTLTMIGSGEMLDFINQSIKNLGLSDCVYLKGNVSNSEVRSNMLNANIFLFTSDRGEGWGAVLNEAMSCGCAVVASRIIGSVPFLIEHQENGLIFESGSLLSLFENVQTLFNDKNKREYISYNAYLTMMNVWSPKLAANRFINLSYSLLNNNKLEFDSGPCSPVFLKKSKISYVFLKKFKLFLKLFN